MAQCKFPIMAQTVPHGTVLHLNATYTGRTRADGTKQINLFNFRHQFCIDMGLVMQGIWLNSQSYCKIFLPCQPDAKSRVCVFCVLVGDVYCTWRNTLSVCLSVPAADPFHKIKTSHLCVPLTQQCHNGGTCHLWSKDKEQTGYEQVRAADCRPQ